MDSKRKYEKENPFMIKGQVIIVEQDGRNCEDIQLIKIATRDGYFNEFEYGVVGTAVETPPSEAAEPGASIQLKPGYYEFAYDPEGFGDAYAVCKLPIELINGATYTVTFNNNPYKVKATLIEEMGFVVAGNISMLNPSATNTNEPFLIGSSFDAGTFMGIANPGINSVSIVLDLSELGGSGGSGGSGSGGGDITIEGVGGVILNSMRVTGMSVNQTENTMDLTIATDTTYDVLKSCYENNYVVRNTVSYNNDIFELHLASMKSNRIVLGGLNPAIKSNNYADTLMNYFYVIFESGKAPRAAFKSVNFA